MPFQIGDGFRETAVTHGSNNNFQSENTIGSIYRIIVRQTREVTGTPVESKVVFDITFGLTASYTPSHELMAR